MTCTRGPRHDRATPSHPLFRALAALCLLAVGCASETARPPDPVRAIKWTALTADDTRAERRLSGIVRPVQQSQLSFEVPGRVERIDVALGDRVREGELLAALDPRPFELAVHKADAALKESEAIRWRERAEFERFEALYAAAAASRAELDRARAAKESAESRLRAARAQLELARRDLRNASLRAPFDGVISIKDIDPFVEVAAGQPIFELDSEDRFEVAVGVPSRLIDRVKRGQEVEVRVSALGRSGSADRIDGHGGEVLRVAGVVQRVGTRSLEASTFPIRVRIEESVEGLRAGMSAEVAIALGGDEPEARAGRRTVFRVPLAALASAEANGHVVFRFERDDSVVVRTPVELVEVHAHEAEVAGTGLRAGDVVATAGVEFLADGQTVRLAALDTNEAS